MQPIHLAIGIVEGLVTAAVITFVWSARPEVLQVASGSSTAGFPLKKILVGLAAVAVLTGGFLSWFASTSPDGLEWSMLRTAGRRTCPLPEARPIRPLPGSRRESRSCRITVFGWPREERRPGPAGANRGPMSMPAAPSRALSAGG
jgi:hypothetical protein